MSELYTKLIEQAKIKIPSGASFTGDMGGHIHRLYALLGEDAEQIITAIEPGDFVRVGGDIDPGISLALPIAYDVWYLIHTENILPFETAADEQRTLDILVGLDTFLTALQNIKPLRALRNYEDLFYGHGVDWMDTYYENVAPYMIKEMRFETILSGESLQYDSDGNAGAEDNLSIGYLSFPVGHLGVMEILSLISESMTEADGFSISSQEAIVEGGEMMPPVHNNRGHCIGTHIVEEGYLIQGDNTEYPASDFEGQESVAPHNWLRHWIREDDTWPVPGEFISLVAKSNLYHVWWFQPTMPFLYGGNWFETEQWTSGIVKEVIAPAGSEVTNIYRVRVKCFDLYLRPTDFYEYEVDDRVAIIKGIPDYLLSDTTQPFNFDWTKLEDRDSESSGSTPDPDWVIAPISFY